jgi:hypothetical protein
VAANVPLRGRERGEVAFLASPLDVGIAADRGQARTRRIDQDAIERAQERERTAAVDVHHVRVMRAGLRDGAAQDPQAAGTHVARHENTFVAHVTGERGRLPPGGRAQVQDALARACAHHRRDQLRRLVLDDPPSGVVGGESPVGHILDDQSVRRVDRRSRADISGAEPFLQGLARTGQGVGAHGHGWGRVVESHP